MPASADPDRGPGGRGGPRGVVWRGAGRAPGRWWGRAAVWLSLVGISCHNRSLKHQYISNERFLIRAGQRRGARRRAVLTSMGGLSASRGASRRMAGAGGRGFSPGAGVASDPGYRRRERRGGGPWRSAGRRRPRIAADCAAASPQPARQQGFPTGPAPGGGAGDPRPARPGQPGLGRVFPHVDRRWRGRRAGPRAGGKGRARPRAAPGTRAPASAEGTHHPPGQAGDRTGRGQVSGPRRGRRRGCPAG